MARNEHKTDLRQLSEAYRNVINENTEATSASFGDNKGHDGPWKNPRRKRPDSGDAAMEFDERGFAKNTKAGKEDEELHPATRAGEEIVGSDVIWDNHQMKGIVKKVDVELGMAIAIDDKGEPHIIELGAVDAILDPNTETPEEFKHLY
tara:strand:+ start:153 stop:599 length:447 start_codon:yes stop_codon:yes gene_type:complete